MREHLINPVWKLIAANEIEVAVKLARGFEDERTVMRLQTILQTRTSSLYVLSPIELQVVRVSAATAYLLGEGRKLERFYPPKFTWHHTLTLHAAAHNLIAAYQVQLNAAAFRSAASVASVRVTNSVDGPCEVCKLAAEGEYSPREAPSVPVTGCTNDKDGCRCALIIARIQNHLK
jgi:hypothetical protein